MNRLIKWFVGFAIAYFAMSGALHYGGIWNLRAQPALISYQAPDGRDATGKLSREWSGAWTIEDDGGQVYMYPSLDSLGVIAFQPRAGATYWRSMLLVSLVSSLIVIGLFWGRWKKDYRKTLTLLNIAK